MLGVVAERDAPLPAVDENADLPWRHGKLGFGQKPAGHQSVGERHRGGVGTGKPHQPETVGRRKIRSEEHTSELQSLMRISYAVFCLKKKKQKNTKRT